MPPRLIVFAGPPCAGKTSLAAELAARRGLPHLQMDTTRSRILPGSAHTREDRAVAYRAMHFAAELLLSSGAGVILDAPYGHPEDRREVAQLAALTRAAAFLVECAVPPEIAVERFHLRGPDPVRRDLTAERVHQLASSFPYARLGLFLDTAALDAAACLRRVEAWLDTAQPTNLDCWI